MEINFYKKFKKNQKIKFKNQSRKKIKLNKTLNHKILSQKIKSMNQKYKFKNNNKVMKIIFN